MYSFNDLKDGYTKLWNQCKVIKTKEASSQAALITQYKSVYEDIGKEVGVPWYAIGVLHLREAGPQDVGRWECVLHNGERIVGTGKRTHLVPEGRGPFKTFKEAAIDAINLEGLQNRSEWKTNPIEFLAYVSEKFNGFGYRNHNIPSPYLWGGTNIQAPGKYISDGHFDPTVMDTQLGTMAILKYLQPTVSTPATTGAVVATAGVAAATYHYITYWPWAVGAVIAIGIMWGLYHLLKNKGKVNLDADVVKEDVAEVRNVVI